eukprot:COSAG06_NODE_61394_length_268_cov_0.455621_1_plen_83_part_01
MFHTQAMQVNDPPPPPPPPPAPRLGWLTPLGLGGICVRAFVVVCCVVLFFFFPLLFWGFFPPPPPPCQVTFATQAIREQMRKT